MNYWIKKKYKSSRKTIHDAKLSRNSFIHVRITYLKFYLYLGLYLLFLSLFHNKKRWYYFDHGIFSLHYFSFLLLVFLLLFLINKGIDAVIQSTVLTFILIMVNIIGVGWMLYYFYPAHHSFYEETCVLSFIKTSMLFFINVIIIVLLLSLFAIYTFINSH